ncbi:hypothetical protein C8F01DRAFT_1163539 [Mycena amicta]|nr:hypothetical protein C8F01DRAFT_1163539 [Mycena amicta]
MSSADAFTETHTPVPSPSVAHRDRFSLHEEFMSPIFLRRRLAVHSFIAPVMIYTVVAKVALMAIVRDLRFELSDICQWSCFIISAGITVLFIGKGKGHGDSGLASRLLMDFQAFLLAVTWRNTMQLNRILTVPTRRISALFQRRARSTGGDYPKSDPVKGPGRLASGLRLRIIVRFALTAFLVVVATFIPHIQHNRSVGNLREISKPIILLLVMLLPDKFLGTVGLEAAAGHIMRFYFPGLLSSPYVDVNDLESSWKITSPFQDLQLSISSPRVSLWFYDYLAFILALSWNHSHKLGDAISYSLGDEAGLLQIGEGGHWQALATLTRRMPQGDRPFSPSFKQTLF